MKHSRFHTFLRRCCALTLVAALSVPTALAAPGRTVLENVHEPASDLIYTNTVGWYDAGRLESFTLELEEIDDVFPILLQASGTVYGTATVNAAVKQAQEMGYQVLAAVNTDFFSSATGVPMGIVIEEGIYKSDADGNPAVVVTKDKVLLCEDTQVSLTLYNETADEELTPNYFNKYRAESGGIYLLNEHFSSVSTRTSTPGWFVRMAVVDYDPEEEDHRLGVNSELELEVTELIRSEGAVSIGPGEYILTAADACGLGSTFARFSVGDRIVLTTECEDDDLSDALWAGGVGDILVQGGDVTDSAHWEDVKQESIHTLRAPRTALGVRRDGTLVLYAVDGRNSAHSVGLTLADLAQTMEDLNCRWAVNLDGGGSTTASVWVPGQSGPAVQNRPSDGKARPCATFLLLVTEEEGNGRADQLAFTDSGLVVLTESSVKLPEAVVLDDGLNILDKKFHDLTVTSRKKLGDVEDGIYTAGDEAGTEVLRLRSRDLGVTGEATLHVVDELTGMTVLNADTGKALSALSVAPGEQLRLDVTGTYYGLPALRGLCDAVEIEVDEELAKLEEDGLLTFSETPQSGQIVIRAGGLKTSISVTVRNRHADVGPDHWAYEAVSYCYEHNIVSGISDTEFGAEGKIRRADFMLMLYAAMGRPAVSVPCTFTDVSTDDYYYTALAWAQDLGLISGIGDGSCAATATITREQTYTILRKAMALWDKDCPDAPLSALKDFRDLAEMADYAKAPTATLAAQGIIGGTELVPKADLIRAEMAQLLYNIITCDPLTEYPDLEPDPVAPETPVIPETPAAPEPQTPSEQSPVLTMPDDPRFARITDAELGLNVRSGPGTDHSIRTRLYTDTVILITEELEGWYRILYTENNALCGGYVSADYVAPFGEGEQVGADTPDGDVQLPAGVFGQVVDAEAGLNVRSGPGTDREVLTKLSNGTPVIVLARAGGWCAVYYEVDGILNPGFVSADYIRF